MRDTNEDRCFYRPFTYTDELGPEKGLIAAVADGMGGHVAGEAASELAIQVFASKFSGMASRGLSRHSCPDWPRLLREAFETANALVCQEASRWPGRAGMGATLTAALVADDVMYFGHAGDSRAYIIRNGQIMQLTHDHTWVAARVRNGLMTPGEAESSDRRGELTEAIGIRNTVQPEIDAIALRPGDRILLCTDGITEMLPDADILAACERGTDLHRLASRLVVTANRAGGCDNSAVVLIECRPDSQRHRSCLPRLRAPKWAVAALAIVMALLLADAGYLAVRCARARRVETQAAERTPAPTGMREPGRSAPGNAEADSEMLDLSGRPVEVAPP